MKHIIFSVFFLVFSSQAFALERYIVTGDDLYGIQLAIQQHGGNVVKGLSFKSAVVANINERVQKALQRKYGEGISFERDVVFSINARKAPPSQPKQTIPWGVDRIGSPQAFLQSRGLGVTVCVVDTGVDLDHPDLQANIVGGINTINSRRTANDDNGHGTHVAGIIAALDNTIGVVGVAPDAKIFAIKGLNSQGSGWSSDLAEGIYACINNNTRVINMSWGSATPSQIIYDALLDAYNAGLVLVAAAGNESSGVIYPAAHPEVLAVSAIDSNMQLAWFSNYGPEIDYAAPGVSINSTYLNGGYRILNGTSMASPHVAGVVALWLSSGSLGLVGEDINLQPYFQGNGLIDADATVNNF